MQIYLLEVGGRSLIRLVPGRWAQECLEKYVPGKRLDKILYHELAFLIGYKGSVLVSQSVSLTKHPGNAAKLYHTSATFMALSRQGRKGKKNPEPRQYLLPNTLIILLPILLPRG